MFYVYLLRSESSPKQVYTGFTEDLRQRLADHNAGLNAHTKRFMPWVLETYLAFSEREQALDFERYLKTASGIAFGRKRLRQSEESENVLRGLKSEGWAAVFFFLDGAWTLAVPLEDGSLLLPLAGCCTYEQRINCLLHAARRYHILPPNENQYQHHH